MTGEIFMLTNQIRLTTYIIAICLLQACGAVEKKDNTKFNVAGNSRVATSKTTIHNGNVVVQTWHYDDLGRTIEIKGSGTGEPDYSITFKYDNTGKQLSRTKKIADPNRADSLTNYVYEGERFVGQINSIVGKPPRSITQFFYDNEQMAGYETKVLDGSIERPTFSDGKFYSRGKFSYNNRGYLNKLEHRRKSGGGHELKWKTNKMGHRLASEKRDLKNNLMYSIEITYEDALCLESSRNSVEQWVCVQTP